MVGMVKIKMSIGTNNWDVETSSNKSENTTIIIIQQYFCFHNFSYQKYLVKEWGLSQSIIQKIVNHILLGLK